MSTLRKYVNTGPCTRIYQNPNRTFWLIRNPNDFYFTIFISPAAAKKVVSLFSQFFFQVVIIVLCSSRETDSSIKQSKTFYTIKCRYSCLRGIHTKNVMTTLKKKIVKQRYDLLRCGGQYYIGNHFVYFM